MKRIKELETRASTIIGDGKSPNLFFVSHRGVVVTITRSFERAYAEWKCFAAYQQFECALEDRQTGVIASVEPLVAGAVALQRHDDSYHFGYRTGRD